ncbi:hypothetical protein GOODEAATRI_000195 [Goodea atripinnis]|uniref:Uncharacterized protein n=1 Tax=Goodea atripinnis TaxID=208336 RepID=A0ABV0P1R7_9TELE
MFLCSSLLCISCFSCHLLFPHISSGVSLFSSISGSLSVVYVFSVPVIPRNSISGFLSLLHYFSLFCVAYPSHLCILHFTLSLPSTLSLILICILAIQLNRLRLCNELTTLLPLYVYQSACRGERLQTPTLPQSHCKHNTHIYKKFILGNICPCKHLRREPQ